MPRPFTRAQHQENRAFLNALARTGNAHEAARAVGAHRAKFTRRRNAHPHFATQWDAALALAHATLSIPPRHGEGDRRPQAGGGGGDTTLGATLHRTPSGRLQLRRPGGRRRLTPAHQQAFLAALSATANVRLSAAAAGFTHAAFYAHRRHNPGFAREWRLALQIGYERLEQALLESYLPAAYEDDAWRHNDPPPIPRMTAAEALQLLYLHQKEAWLWSEPDYIKRRRGESSDAWSFRLGEMYAARQQRAREAFDVAEAARREGRQPSPFEPAPPPLPALDQVTGWSNAQRRPADGAGEAEADKGIGKPALFGGWRLKDWEAKG
ncbi:hypothetical protein ACFO8O_07115 [Hephaestia sp. GCM10023244]|uniref:hypothetical protein n=1 Tax=unclassified Hephaestia TaxID=2631281 RepID=UPI0020776E81|nr:hypothetical protein [Hephaestia sp. MAHUQ-44]MCM8730737.1 hypothetical protein [Hephaestia sp. MAHUQ-44]